MPIPLAATITVAEIITTIRRQFGDDDAIQITDADIVRWINQGQREIASDNPLNKRVATSFSVGGTYSFTAPSDMYQPEFIRYDGLLLRSMSFEAVSSQYGPDLEQTGIPSIWYTWGSSIYLYPSPNATGKKIEVFYAAAPTAVSLGGILSVPDRYANAIIEFCLARANELDEQPQAQALQEQKFSKSMSDLRGADQQQSGQNFVVSDVDYEDSWEYRFGQYAG